MHAKQLYKNRAATQQAEGNGEPGQKSITVNKNSTTKWLPRQVVKTILPYVATFITNTRFTAQKSLFLDRLIVMAEGGLDDF